jgi:hypothetical protein
MQLDGVDCNYEVRPNAKFNVLGVDSGSDVESWRLVVRAYADRGMDSPDYFTEIWDDPNPAQGVRAEWNDSTLRVSQGNMVQHRGKSYIQSTVAQWKRAGLITRRSSDRNGAVLVIFCFVVHVSSNVISRNRLLVAQAGYMGELLEHSFV